MTQKLSCPVKLFWLKSWKMTVYGQMLQKIYGKNFPGISVTSENKGPAGHHNPPPRPRDRNFTGWILHWSLTFCSTIMIHLSRLLCILQILKSMLVASQHFFSLSKLPLRGYIYIYPSLKPYISFYSIYWTGTYPMEFLFQGLMLWIDLMPYQCWILLVDFNFMCFSLAKGA